MAQDRDPDRLSSPHIYMVRVLIFLVLCGFVALMLYRQIASAFMANPGLNALILSMLALGIIYALRQIWRLVPEVRWVNALRNGSAGRSSRRCCWRPWRPCWVRTAIARSRP
jgi:hypothetical protein